MQLNTTEETVASVAILGPLDSTIDSTLKQPGFERGSEVACTFKKVGESATEENRWNIVEKRIVGDLPFTDFKGGKRR